MANHHFGKIGDVWKHLPLAEILAIEKPLAYWETHAGSASYVMDGAWERDYGIGRLLERAPTDPVLARSRYFQLVSELMQEGRYPGSALLSMKVLGRPVRDYMFCDTDPESIRSLEDAARDLNLSRRTRFFADGIATALRFSRNARWIQPANTVVHIDPFRPFEESAAARISAVELAARLGEQGYKLVYWYGFDQEDDVVDANRGWAWRELAPRLQAAGASCWCGEVVLRAALAGPMQANPGVHGCGIVCTNLSPQSYTTAASLGRALVSIYADAVLPTGESGALVFNEYGG